VPVGDQPSRRVLPSISDCRAGLLARSQVARSSRPSGSVSRRSVDRGTLAAPTSASRNAGRDTCRIVRCRPVGAASSAGESRMLASCASVPRFRPTRSSTPSAGGDIRRRVRPSTGHVQNVCTPSSRARPLPNLPLAPPARSQSREND